MAKFSHMNNQHNRMVFVWQHFTNTVKLYIETTILVMDNLNTHRASSLYKACPPDEARAIE